MTSTLIMRATATGLLLLALALPDRAAGQAARGGELLGRLASGAVTCADTTRSEFAVVGEHVMERMLGSRPLHEAMDRRLVATMGARGAARAHADMGRRFAGCTTGTSPDGLQAMMGMMAHAMGSAGRGPGSLGPGSLWPMDGGGGPGMMGDFRRAGDGWTAGEIAMVATMALFLVLAAVAFVAWRPRRHTDPSPMDTARRRFARGDIDQQEFDRLRAALGGPA